MKYKPKDGGTPSLEAAEAARLPEDWNSSGDAACVRGGAGDSDADEELEELWDDVLEDEGRGGRAPADADVPEGGAEHDSDTSTSDSEVASTKSGDSSSD